MRPLLVALITVAALTATPAATLAKGATDGRVCGAGGCQAVDHGKLGTLFPNGLPTDPPSAAAPFATVELDMSHGPDGQPMQLAYDYLPSLGIARPHDSTFFSDPWIAVMAQARRGLDEALRGVQLRPAAEFPAVAGLPQPAALPDPRPAPADRGGPAWWAIAGASLAALALALLVARYARTSILKARPRASKSTN